MTRPARVCVLGAGVVGLTAAYALDRAGYRVRVVADRVAARAPSRTAGAVWLPYLVDAEERAPRWARAGYGWLAAGVARPGFGVHALVPIHLVVDSDARDAGLEASLPDGVLPRWTDVRGLPEPVRGHATRTGASGAWTVDVPIVTPPEHVAWLREQLARVPFEERTVGSLEPADEELLVNCTGRRARALTGDTDLVPTLGVIALSSSSELPRDHAFADDRDHDAPAYALPRASVHVFGGCSMRVDPRDAASWTSPDGPAPPADVAADVVARCARAGYDPGDEVELHAEWRPARDSMTVRFEPDPDEPRIHHDYGHGGAGFTLAYGCALDLVDWVERTT